MNAGIFLKGKDRLKSYLFLLFFKVLWYNYICIGVREFKYGDYMGKRMVLKCG